VSDCCLYTIEDAVKLATVMKRCWFRGHSKIEYELIPSVFRHEFDEVEQLFGDREVEFMTEFARTAPSFMTGNIPKYRDWFSWLLMMQHHGAPTRILDWSESALTALYFAVRDNKDHDGCLWVINPGILNGFADINGYMPHPDHPKLQYLACQPFYASPNAHDALGLKEKPNIPIAFLPPIKASRMIGQLSAFTIHPKPDGANQLTDILTDPKHIRAYRIPAIRKVSLLSDLYSLGITESTLFPSLDSLSVSIKQRLRTSAPPEPEPPSFTPNPALKNEMEAIKTIKRLFKIGNGEAG